MILFYKADVAASKDTIDDLEASLKYLKEAYGFEMDQIVSVHQLVGDALIMSSET